MGHYKTGEKPPKGIYVCLVCGTSVRVDETKDTLPTCPNCGNPTFWR